MQRRILLAGLAAGAALAAPAAAPAATIGVSDQNASMFANPLFPQLKAKNVRYVLPFDYASDPDQLNRWNAYHEAAEGRGERILVSFEHSRKSTSQARKLPSVKAYTTAITAFKKAYPDVRDISVWNEVNRKIRAGGEGQPTAGVKNAKRTAQYFDASRKVFKGSKYKIVALDVLDEQNPGGAIAYIKAFKKAAKGTPKIWGLHNYSDTNRFSQTRTKKIIKAFGKGEVWLTETGGIVLLGSGAEGAFKYDVNRANKALGCMFDIARDNKAKIKRLYVYNFFAGAETQPFDSGLLNLDLTKRPGFDTVVARKARNC